jgi:hypothetical protein
MTLPLMISFPMAGSYYKLNSVEKANAILSDYGDVCDSNLKYYLDQKINFVQSAENDIQYSLSMLNRMAEICRINNQNQLNQRLDSLFNMHYQVFMDKTSRTQQ